MGQLADRSVAASMAASVALALTGAAAHAQDPPTAARTSEQGGVPRGYTFGSWQPTPWSMIEVRTRCEGDVGGMFGGRMKWTVEIHNRSNRPANLDYAIIPPKGKEQGQTPDRVTIKPGRV